MAASKTAAAGKQDAFGLIPHDLYASYFYFEGSDSGLLFGSNLETV